MGHTSAACHNPRPALTPHRPTRSCTLRTCQTCPCTPRTSPKVHPKTGFSCMFWTGCGGGGQRTSELQGKEGRTFSPQRCLLWRSRGFVVPPLRDKVIAALYEAHPGVVHMKALARSYVWWPGIDKQIEDWVKRFQICQESWPAPPKATSCEWESAREPWSRVHVDFAGPF